MMLDTPCLHLWGEDGFNHYAFNLAGITITLDSLKDIRQMSGARVRNIDPANEESSHAV